MALAEDQRAMLQLLLEGGQSYADIGSLLGVDAAEVRTRARRALTEIGGADPDAQVGLTDYLLGQADPIGRADAARHLQSDAAAGALAARLAAQLRLLAPNARLPDLPGISGVAPVAAPFSPRQPGATSQTPPAVGAPGGPSAPAGAARTGARVAGGARNLIERIGGAFAGLGARERRLPVALGAGALLIVLVVLAATGVIFGGSDGGGSGSSSSADTSTNGAAGDVVVVPLQPQGGSKAGGQVTFTRIQDQPVLQINVFGLQPNSKDEAYIVWLYNSDSVAFPVARANADSKGNLTGAAALPAQLSGLVGPNAFDQVDISLASNSETAKALKTASSSKQLPKHSGTSVLRGPIPASAAAIAASATAGGTSTTPVPAPAAPAPAAPAPTATTP